MTKVIQILKNLFTKKNLPAEIARDKTQQVLMDLELKRQIAQEVLEKKKAAYLGFYEKMNPQTKYQEDYYRQLGALQHNCIQNARSYDPSPGGRYSYSSFGSIFGVKYE